MEGGEGRGGEVRGMLALSRGSACVCACLRSSSPRNSPDRKLRKFLKNPLKQTRNTSAEGAAKGALALTWE